MITYEYKSEEVTVFLDKKVIGHIRKNPDNTWYYQPKGNKKFRGDNFKSVQAVQRSLESE